jgi:hypothetical protein
MNAGRQKTGSGDGWGRIALFTAAFFLCVARVAQEFASGNALGWQVLLYGAGGAFSAYEVVTQLRKRRADRATNAE